MVWQSPTRGSSNRPSISAFTVADGLTPASFDNSASMRSRWLSVLFAALALAVRCAPNHYADAINESSADTLYAMATAVCYLSSVPLLIGCLLLR